MYAVPLCFGEHRHRALVVSGTDRLVYGWTIRQALPEQEPDKMRIPASESKMHPVYSPIPSRPGAFIPKETASFCGSSMSTVSNSWQ